MEERKLKWGMIQPLTGGMYIGARNAIGHDAEWIISYPGLSDCKKDKNDNIIGAGNEYNLLQWFDKHNINVPYYTFAHKMFDFVNAEDVVINEGTPDFNDIDIVCAVPVCSGLSQATIANDDTKSTRNCNMEFIADYTLSTIKPKVYIFENAPTLYSNKGASVRTELNEIADKYGYSVVYYKTDTQYHDNCQRRPRTFVVFVKYNEDKYGAPMFNYEHIITTVDEYISRIPEDATQQYPVQIKEEAQAYLDFIIYKYGEDWREKTRAWMLYEIIDYNLFDELLTFIDNGNYSQECKDKSHHTFEHIQDKLSQGKNYYVTLPQHSTDTVQSAIFKNIITVVHHKENRLFNVREWLHMMGMPHDFEMAGNIQTNGEYPKIGQNVPARTAEWIVSEAVRIVCNWDSIDRNGDNVKFFDNTKYTG